jgi:hypothetical protein
MYVIEEDPQQAYPRGDMGNIQFRTGDPIIDEWEKKLAEGKDPSEIDWDVGVEPSFLKRFKEYSKGVAERMSPALAEARLKQDATQLPDDERDEFLNSLVGFTDDYTR